LTSQEIYLLKALMSYIKKYDENSYTDMLQKELEQKQKVQLPASLTNANKIEDLINSGLTAEDLKDVLTSDQLLHKRIHDIKKFLEGPADKGKGPLKFLKDFVLIRWRGLNQEFYENFVKDVKSVMNTQKGDIINCYNAEKTDKKEHLENNKKIHEFPGFNYDNDVGTNPGLQMYAILNDYRNPGMIAKRFEKVPGVLVFFQTIFQPNIFRDLMLLAMVIGMIVSFGYMIAGIVVAAVVGTSIFAAITSSGALSMISMAPIGAYFIGAFPVNFFREEPNKLKAHVPMEGLEKKIKDTGPDHGFGVARKQSLDLTTVPASRHSAGGGLSSPRPEEGGPRLITSSIDNTLKNS